MPSAQAPPRLCGTLFPTARLWLLAVVLSIAWQGTGVLAFDHSYRELADSVLTPFTSGGCVDYAALGAQRSALDRFLGSCAEVSFEEYRSFTRSEQIAFLINLYNTATLQLVLDRKPAHSLRDLGGLFRSPWTIRFVRLFGRTVSLGNILHDVLRPEFKDPRVHLALCDASRGSPALTSVPYRAETLEQQLEECARIYMLARPDMNGWDGHELHLSPLFRWYSNDFGKTEGVRAFANKYFPAAPKDARIRYSGYDWSLNSR